jgi:hypothetical protein
MVSTFVVMVQHFNKFLINLLSFIVPFHYLSTLPANTSAFEFPKCWGFRVLLVNQVSQKKQCEGYRIQVAVIMILSHRNRLVTIMVKKSVNRVQDSACNYHDQK